CGSLARRRRGQAGSLRLPQSPLRPFVRRGTLAQSQDRYGRATVEWRRRLRPAVGMRQAVAQKVKPQRTEKESGSGCQDEAGGKPQVFAARIEHRSPFGSRGRRPKAEKGEARGRGKAQAHPEGRERDQRSRRVAQQVSEEDP